MAIFQLSDPVAIPSQKGGLILGLSIPQAIPSVRGITAELSEASELSFDFPSSLYLATDSESIELFTGTLSYLTHPTLHRYLQTSVKTTNGEIHTRDTSGFNIIKNSIFLKSVHPTYYHSLREFVLNVLYFNEVPFTLALKNNCLGLVDFGRGFEQNPVIENCYLETTNTDDMFKFEEPGHYDIIIPYSFKEY